VILPTTEQLRLSDFDFYLPEALIAQTPCPRRDYSRLMLFDRGTEQIKHIFFSGIKDYFLPGDVLVLNDTKVFPCRLPAKKIGGGRAEIFLVSEREQNLWNALVKGGVNLGKKLHLNDGIEAEIIEKCADDTWVVRFSGVDDIKKELHSLGKVPLPPYIKRNPTEIDRDRYQTVYASQEGAVAAPTAGLHFTEKLLRQLSLHGVEIVTITLHVGPGTFQPVRVDAIAGHRMLPEYYIISQSAADRINNACREKRRVIAVGTTCVRSLETAALNNGTVCHGEGQSTLFIYPGYRFKIINGLITNFHLPKSTLLMLVSAFAGRERILSLYRTAVKEKYRFYSYGDAMFIL